MLTVTCPPGVLGGSVLRVDDDGQPVLNPYGEPIVNAGPALNKVLFSSYAVVVPDDVVPGQQFTIRVEVDAYGKDSDRRLVSMARCSCCKRSNVVMDDLHDAGITRSPPLPARDLDGQQSERRLP